MLFMEYSGLIGAKCLKRQLILAVLKLYLCENQSALKEKMI